MDKARRSTDNKAGVELEEFGNTDWEQAAMLDDNNHKASRSNCDEFGRTDNGPAPDSENDLNYNKKRARLKYSKTWNTAWLEFCSETSFHGLKQITEPQPFLLRRLFWLMLVLVGSGLFLYQMITGIIYYYDYPVSVNVKINHNDSIKFPAITICNQNAFRQTVAADNGWYELLSEVFTDRDSASGGHADISRYNASQVSLYEIYRRTSHSKRDLIIECSWDGQSCGAEDFTTTFTDYGVCYTFNSGRDGILRKAKRTGTEGGLQLLLNVEQYEYMMGPNNGAGLRVLVHSQTEVPMVKEFGVAIPPGSQSFLGITLIRVDNLPKPHGKCDAKRSLQYHDVYSNMNCREENLQNFLQERCACRHINMEDHDNGLFPQCTIEQYFSCVVPVVDEFNKLIATFDCPIPCLVDSHALFNSISYISNFDALNLLHSNLTRNLQNPYKHSLEVSQRVSENIVRIDNKMLNEMIESLTSLEQAMDDISSNTESIAVQMNENFVQMEKRLNFHKVKGLDKVLFIMEHDFVRGWTILEERTLPFFTVNFMELVFSFKQAIKRLEETRGTADYQLALGQWLNVENRFLERLDIAVRVEANVTEVQNSYKTGKPLLRFSASLNRRYDMSYITVDLLQAVVDNGEHDQDEFFELIFHNYYNVVNSSNTFIEIGWNVTKNIKIDPAVLSKNERKFTQGCIFYNYNIFRFKTRIVDGPVTVMKKRIEEFERLNRTLYESRAALQRTIASIRDPISKLEEGSWSLLRSVAQNVSDYLSNNTYSKWDTATFVTSSKVTEAIQDVQNVFDELRLYGRDLQEKLSDMKISLFQMWTNMLSEFTTMKFYDKVNRDFIKFLDNPSFFYPYFADLLDITEAEVRRLTTEELEYMMNADFPTSNISNKIHEIRSLFETFEERIDVGARIGTMDEHLFKSLDTLRQSLTKFRNDIIIDSRFYRTNFMRLDIYMQELSYEEIIQQPAYELLNLLGDIGGSVGLFLGASAMSLAEILDVIFLQGTRLFYR